MMWCRHIIALSLPPSFLTLPCLCFQSFWVTLSCFFIGLCVCVCIARMLANSIGSSGGRLTGTSEPLGLGAGNQIQVLKEQNIYRLLATLAFWPHHTHSYSDLSFIVPLLQSLPAFSVFFQLGTDVDVKVLISRVRTRCTREQRVRMAGELHQSILCSSTWSA